MMTLTDDSEQQPGFLALIMQSRWCGSIQGPEGFNKCSLNNGQPRLGDYQLPILNFFATILSSFKCGSHHSEVFHSTTMMVTVSIERNSKTAPQNVAHSIHDREKNLAHCTSRSACANIAIYAANRKARSTWLDVWNAPFPLPASSLPTNITDAPNVEFFLKCVITWRSWKGT